MKTIRLNGVVYDITNFNHPGGSIINYAGQGEDDAGDAFREFHSRSAKARATLASLPKVSNSNSESEPVIEPEICTDFRIMRQRLDTMGCFEPDYIHVYFRLLELVFFFGMGVFLVPYNVYASMLAFIVFKTRCGWVQHEAGHLSLTGIKSMDRGIQMVTMGFGGGVSSTLWNSMHNKHHAAPQRINHDIDLDTTPFVAFFKTAFENNTRMQQLYKNKVTERLVRLWMRFQAWLFIPITNGILVHLFWTYYLHPQRAFRHAMSKKSVSAVSELSLIGLSHIVIPAIFYSLSPDHFNMSIAYCYFLYMICNVFNFIYLFGHFSLSHTFTGVIPETESLRWFEYAIRHSVNISTRSALVTWIMGYLNFQIEHHLFPSMPQYKNVLAAPVVREFCTKWNKEKENDPDGTGSSYSYINYVEVGYWYAWKKMFQNLNDIGIHYYKHGVVGSTSTPHLPDNQEQKQKQKQKQEEDVVDVDLDDCDDKIKLD
jgi:fatty acid desaturase 2 (delta-6 desaturase)